MSSNINPLTDEVLIKSITEILESADLNVMTQKLVRNELKIKLNVEDLDSRKKQINCIINDVIKQLNENNRKQTKANHIKSQPKDEKSESEKSTSDDSCDDSKELSDQQLAQKLHNEELDSKRSTRTTRHKPTKTVRKAKKKKNTDDSDTDKPKRKNGYLKPCTLSPDLADFLGEAEMARHEVVKRIWSYVRENNLLDPKNKQFAICDNQLNKIFGRKRVRMFGMMKFLAKHLN